MIIFLFITYLISFNNIPSSLILIGIEINNLLQVKSSISIF